MPRSEGYATWTDRESGKLLGEAKTHNCCHCGFFITFHDAMGIAIADASVWCGTCAAPQCPSCAAKGSCVPFEKKIDTIEKRGNERSRLLREMGIVGLLLVLIAACSSLPRVQPRLRSDLDAARATVRIEASCGDWWSHVGTGVIVSERAVLTAAHVVAYCPELPTIVVELFDHRRMSVIVDRDDLTFGDERTDLARLVIPSGSTFRRFIAPPMLGNSDGLHYGIATRWDMHRGDRRALARFVRPGDSGAGVYTPSGALVGLLLGTDETGGIRIVRVDDSWL